MLSLTISVNVLAVGEISALAADWITGNLYGVSYAGFVFVCDTTRAQACTVLRRDQGSLHGIAVHPAKGCA